jgi:hypothetical protein
LVAVAQWEMAYDGAHEIGEATDLSNMPGLGNGEEEQGPDRSRSRAPTGAGSRHLDWGTGRRSRVSTADRR